MKNIHTILAELGVTVPEDKKADLDKAVAENYKTSAEHEKKVNRLTDDLSAMTKRAETAESALKGFDGLDPEKVKEQIADANRQIKAAQDEANRQIAERDTRDAISALLAEVEFTSPAARRDVERQLKEKGLKLENGSLLGGTDALDAIRKAEPESFVVKANVNRPRFTDPKTNNTNQSVLNPKEISKIKDHSERRKAWENYLSNKGE
jgi:hypothetical protein